MEKLPEAFFAPGRLVELRVDWRGRGPYSWKLVRRLDEPLNGMVKKRLLPPTGRRNWLVESTDGRHVGYFEEHRLRARRVVDVARKKLRRRLRSYPS